MNTRIGDWRRICWCLLLLSGTGIAAPTAEESRQQQAAAWELLAPALDACVSRSIELLDLRPSNGVPVLNWSAGERRGTLRGWESPGKASWAVRSVSQQRDGDAHSLGFTLWLAPEIVVPHLGAHVSVRGGTATLMADHFPRWDLAENRAALEQYYGGDYAAQWAALQRPGEGVEFFSSGDPKIRAVRGPNAIALRAEIGSADEENPLGVVRVLVATLRDHCERWVGFVEDYVATGADDPAARPVIAERDLALRRLLRDHEQAAGERVFGREKSTALANHHAGFAAADEALFEQ